MKRIVTISGSLVAFMAALGVVSLVGTATPVRAADQPATSSSQTTSPVKKLTDYTYTAGSGDSYTAMVRKAVQTYGINNQVDLGNARIIYIETMMSQQAGSPFLWVGQKVTIKGSDVAAWANKALKLSHSDVAAWQTYVPYVNFNTDQVGRGEAA